MTDHNYVNCQEPLCQRCEDYSAGYREGKSEVLFEGSTQATDHTPGCGCDSCQAPVERLRRQGLLGSRNDSAVGGLDVELALLLGIELGGGELL